MSRRTVETVSLRGRRRRDFTDAMNVLQVVLGESVLGILTQNPKGELGFVPRPGSERQVMIAAESVDWHAMRRLHEEFSE